MSEIIDSKPTPVLIIDDEQGLRDMLIYGLKKRGFEAVAASDGDEAIRLAKERSFDLAVCDIMMPGRSGVDVLKSLKEIQPDMQVVMATGYATLESAVETMKNGAFDYITKPYSLSHLCAVFDKAREHKLLTAKVNYLEELNKLKSEFMATMSHELRTPLASILGYVALIIKKVYSNPPEKEIEVLRRIDVNAKNLLQLINNILDLSKLSAHRMSLFNEPFDIREMVQEVVDSMGSLAVAKKLSLTMEAPEAFVLLGDRSKLKQVLINLIGNAIKFTKAGTITVTVKPDPGAGQVVMTVKDTGIGIKPSDIALLFQEFKQLDSSETREYGGTGLGLSICKKILELMKGSVEVSSVLGEGSSFIVRLPINSETNSKSSAAIEPPAASADMQSDTDDKVILSIDDDPDVLRVLRDSLSGTGYRFVGAQSGEEGIALARKLKPQAITLDIMMPHMDGWSVLQVFKGDPVLSSIPVYILSVADNKALAFSMGVTDYILKPFDREELLSKLNVLQKTKVQQILVVDKDPNVRETFVNRLNVEGYEVEVVSTGEEAVARMKVLKPDILFLDLVLPQMSGFEVLAAMEDMALKDMPLIFVMTERELSVEQHQYLNRRVEMIVRKHATSLDGLLASLKGQLVSRKNA